MKMKYLSFSLGLLLGFSAYGQGQQQVLQAYRIYHNVPDTQIYNNNNKELETVSVVFSPGCPSYNSTCDPLNSSESACCTPGNPGNPGNPGKPGKMNQYDYITIIPTGSNSAPTVYDMNLTTSIYWGSSTNGNVGSTTFDYNKNNGPSFQSSYCEISIESPTYATKKCCFQLVQCRDTIQSNVPNLLSYAVNLIKEGDPNYSDCPQGNNNVPIDTPSPLPDCPSPPTQASSPNP